MSRSRPRPIPNPNAPKKRVNRHNLALFIEALLDGATLREIVEHTGINYETIRPTINEMHPRVVYIEAWKQDSLGRWSIAVYRLGRHVDAKKPRPRTMTERTRAYLQRKAPPELAPDGRAARLSKQEKETDAMIRGAFR